VDNGRKRSPEIARSSQYFAIGKVGILDILISR
jgi:hypothetical protein